MSQTKGIVFSDQIIKAVNEEVKKEKGTGKTFSDFIREATVEKLKKSKENQEQK